jgi:hypothetical protein
LRRVFGVDLTEEQGEAARRTLRALLANQAVPGYVAKVLRPTFHPDKIKQDSTAVVLEAMVQLQVKGLLRLPAQRQGHFVQHVIDVAQAVPPPACKAAYLGRLPLKEASALELRYVASLPLKQFEAVLQLYREAIEAELAGYPSARTITNEQADQTEQALEAASAQRVRVALSPQTIARLSADGERASPSEFCTFVSASLRGLLDLRKPYKSWQLTRFVQAMQ